jgi:HK97 family phage portal protein
MAGFWEKMRSLRRGIQSNAHANIATKAALKPRFADYHGIRTATPWHWHSNPPPSYEALVREGYGRNPVARRAVRLLAEGAASVPWVALEHAQRVAGHEALLLLAQPNPTQAGPSFLEAVVSWLELHGNAYVELVENPHSKQRFALYVLRPERVSVVLGADGWPVEYRYALPGQAPICYPIDQETGWCALLHLKAFNPQDDHYGLGGLSAAAEAIGVHNAAAQWNRSLLGNAARPSGALVYEGGEGWPHLTNEQFERLRQELAEHFTGAQNAGRPLLLEGGLRWQALSLTPADMDFVASKHAAARDIALAFGVPPMLLGLPGDNSYANYQEANRALWRLTLLPLLTRLSAGFSLWFKPFWPDLQLDIDRDAIPALAADRERLWQMVSGAPMLTADEQRAFLGLGAASDSAVFGPTAFAPKPNVTDNFTA